MFLGYDLIPNEDAMQVSAYIASLFKGRC